MRRVHSVAVAAVAAGLSCGGCGGDDTRAEFLEVAEHLRKGSNPWFGTRQVHELRERLASSDLQPSEAAQASVALGYDLLRLGHTDEAVAAIGRAFELAQHLGVEPPPEMHAAMAIARLRQAEVANCIARHNRECCIFPLRGGGVHTVTEPAREARRHYLAYLERRPDDLAIRWMLNLTEMALGAYPDGVPERFRVPPDRLESEHDIGRFVDIAPQLGVDTFNLCGGVAAEDFDGDGWIDIVTSTSDPAGPITFYRNAGNRKFEDTSKASRLDQQLGGLNCLAADYDGDTDMDLLVLRGAWLHDDGRIRNSLLQNDGNGVFADVTRAAGLAEPAWPTQAAVWADFDNDGDLDLYVGNESRPAQGADHPGQLFRNNGDGTFTDIAAAAGVENDRYCKGVAAGDYDNDGDMDLYVSNVGPNRLYRNNGDGTFTDVAKQARVEFPGGRSFAVWFFDFDNDGWLDIMATAYQAKLADIAADHMGLPHEGIPPFLYRNGRDGTFTNVTESAGLGHPWLPMGANFGDLDNDGWLDMYLTTGEPAYDALTPNVMLRNDGGKRFQNVTTSGGFGHLQKGHGVAFADFDHDGDQDIYNQLGGFYPGDKFKNAFYLNPGHGNRFLHVQLVGTKSNRRGVGARVAVTVATGGGSRTVHRACGSTSSFGGSPLRQEIGLGRATRIERVEIFWPVSGSRQVLTGVPLDAIVVITEGNDTLRRVPLRTFRLPR